MPYPPPILALAPLALLGACECFPDPHYSPPPPPDLAPQAYADVRGSAPIEDWRTKELTRVAVAGARAAEGGLYIDVVVESDTTRIFGDDPAWSVASALSRQSGVGPPFGEDSPALLRLRDADGVEVALRESRFWTTCEPLALPCHGHPCILYQHEWTSALDADSGSRFAGTLTFETDAPVAPGPAILLPPAPPAYEEDNALHRRLAIPPEGVPIEVRPTGDGPRPRRRWRRPKDARK